MKIRKVLSLFAVTAFLLTGCSSDDNAPIRPEQKDQLEVSKESPVVGEYSYNHAGNPIPFLFEKNVITMKMSGMAGSGQDDDIYNVITTYKNDSGVLKTVARNKETSEFKAFFFREINTDQSEFMFNMDLTAKTEIEAIKAAYPTKDIAVDHTKGQFGWLKLTKGAVLEPIQLPVTGKYVFAQGTHAYYYNFTNEVINFKGVYDMTVIAHNKNTNKILLQGKSEDVKNNYYVIQLKNITEDKVDIIRLTFSETTAKVDAEKEYASQAEIKANFTTYAKDKESDNTPSLNVLKGTYTTEPIANGLGYYKFTIGEANDAFIMLGNFAEDPKAPMTEGGKLTLNKVFTDEAKGQIIYEITESSGYYAKTQGSFLTIYAKDITKDGSKVTLTMAVKEVLDANGKPVFSMLARHNNLGKTLEEAKTIKAPNANQIFVPATGMMKYANHWIPTTRE